MTAGESPAGAAGGAGSAFDAVASSVVAADRLKGMLPAAIVSSSANPDTSVRFIPLPP